MEMPVNHFKRGLSGGRPQAGCWLSLGSAAAAEICAAAGFDWMMIDMEHAPNDVPQVHQQLQAVAAYPTSAIVRPPWNDTVVIKRLLDLGAQTLLIPYVETADDARKAAAATRYPPKGVRGVSTSTRANRYARVPDYFAKVEQELCVIVQIESRAGIDNLEAIAAVEGIDALFIGPQDLAAGFGHLGNPQHPEMVEIIGNAITRIRNAGKAAGILAYVEAEAKKWMAHGAAFVAVTSDQSILAKESSVTAAKYRGT